MMTTLPWRFVLGAAAAIALVVHASGAQEAQSLVVHVRVADSAGTPVADAEISLMRGVSQVLARGVTDASGRQTFTVVPAGHEVELVVRKIGYRRVSRFYSDTVHTWSVGVVLPTVAHALDAVQITAREDPTHKSYFIDADEINRSPRVLADALDIVTKLKPDMIWGRQGKPDKIDQHVSSSGKRAANRPQDVVRKALQFGYCPPVQNVWVNAARIRDVAINPVAILRRSGDGSFINGEIATVLASIQPEHVEEMQYHNCTDMGPDKPVGSSNAIFVTLKEGIGFTPGVGSYVLSRVVAEAEPSPAPAFRNRILGVFDEDTGEPVASAEVVDVASGTVARTTSSGTITLSFLPAGESKIRVQKAGYAPMVTTVVLSPKDTAGITLVIAHANPKR